MKSSRNNILAAIANHKPAHAPLPEEVFPKQSTNSLPEKFKEVATSIGSRVFPVKGFKEINEILEKEFGTAKRVISNVAELQTFAKGNTLLPEAAPHAYEDVDLAILAGNLAVAENSAIWVAEDKMMHRVLPFICQHLVLVIREKDILPNMHEAYEKSKATEGGYGLFIAGPSKTADIEQSLVLGAHGPRSLSIFVIR